jgi:hypothetical protein
MLIMFAEEGKSQVLFSKNNLWNRLKKELKLNNANKDISKKKDNEIIPE